MNESYQSIKGKGCLINNKKLKTDDAKVDLIEGFSKDNIFDLTL